MNRANAALLSSLGRLPSYEDWLVCIHQDPKRSGYRKFLRDLQATIEIWRQQVDFVVFLIWPWYTEATPYPFAHVHDVLTAAAQRAGAEVLDLHQQTRRIPVTKLRLNDYDAHPNAYANALAATALAEHLVGRGLIKRHGGRVTNHSISRP